MEIKGFTYGFDGKRGDYRSEAGIESQERLYDTGVNWICLAFTIYQKNFYSTEICFDYQHSVTDCDIISAVERAHERGIKVCLKPIVNSKDGIWRALIDFPDKNMWEQDVYWDQWFESYMHFLLHYAELAEETGCEMFCIGCEMCGTERKEVHWRKVIKAVREVYSGSLVYNTNHGKEEDAAWYDAVDYLGTSAYYPVAKKPGESKDKMAEAWQKTAGRLKDVCEKLGKKMIFMEIGCRSAKGCAMMPWDFTHTEFPMDEEEQAAFYDSCLEVFSKEDWFMGVFWWDWSTKIYQDKETACEDKGFNIHLKKAEEVVRKWYRE